MRLHLSRAERPTTSLAQRAVSQRRTLNCRSLLGHTVTLLCCAVLASIATTPTTAQHQEPVPAEELPVVRHTLDNGLTFLILQRDQSPTVALVVHYPVGSVHEHPGNTGIAHVVEHMLFKGSTEIGTTDLRSEVALLDAIDKARDSELAALALIPPDTVRAKASHFLLESLEDQAQQYVIHNEFDQILGKVGARNLNATTSYEATRYFLELPANRLEIWFALEADRMTNPVFREFYTELDVVLEERRLRLETSPGGVLGAALLATAFQLHPYGVPVVGHKSDLETLTRRKAMQYFRAHYGASNAVISVVGDLDSDQVVRWADEYFTAVPAGEPAPPVLAREPPQAGERRVTVEFAAEPRLSIGWKAVSVQHEDAAALSMLASVLTAGRTSRLYRRLVAGDRSAVHVAAYLGPGQAHDRLFIVGAVPRSPHTAQEVEAAIYEEIARLQERPPELEALTRIRNQLRASEFRRLSSNLALAEQLAQSQSDFGDWRETFRSSRKLIEVTPEEIQRVAQLYLTQSRRTVATMVTKSQSSDKEPER